MLIISDACQPSATVSRKARSAAGVRARAGPHGPPAARPDHPDPPLQHRLRLLQRVRQGVAAGADRRDDAAASTSSPSSAPRSSPSAAASRCCTRISTTLIRHIRGRGMMAGLITNGYFLVPKRIEELNDAGPRLPADQHRQHRAGRGVEEEPAAARQEAAAPAATTPRSTSTSTRCSAAASRTPRTRARSTTARASSGFSTSIGIIHDGSGRLKPLGPVERKVYDEVSAAISGAVAGRSRTSIQGFAASRTTWRTASRTSGAAAPARAISTSAKTAWSTTARSSAATPACRSSNYTIDDIRREFVDAEVQY